MVLELILNVKDQKASIRQMIADNHGVILNSKTSYIGWLTEETTFKRASSIVAKKKW